LKARTGLPPLLSKISDTPPETIHYLGVSYGITAQLFKFWKNLDFSPIYLRQTPNEITGEYSCIMFKALTTDEVSPDWVSHFTHDFKKRFLRLLAYEFSCLSPGLALDILLNSALTNNDTSNRSESPSENLLTKSEMDSLFSAYDLKRLDSYARNLVDYHFIMDLLPSLAQLYFQGKFSFSLPHIESSILLAFGLQHKSTDRIVEELSYPANQVLAFFNKAMRKFNQYLRKLQEREVEKTLPAPPPTTEAVDNSLKSLESELKDAEKEGTNILKEKQMSLLKSLGAENYMITGDPKDWEEALQTAKSGKLPTSISIKSLKKRTIPSTLPSKANKAKKLRRKK